MKSMRQGRELLDSPARVGRTDFAAQTNTYREKPLVAFTYQCVCVLEGERVDAAGEQRTPFSLVQTTLSPRINHILQANSRASHFKVPDEVGLALASVELMAAV